MRARRPHFVPGDFIPQLILFFKSLWYYAAMGTNYYDVVVIGGGASGMQAAVIAAERGLSVAILEQNAQLGVKLGITGGGRCNILNAEPDTRALLSHYGEAAPFLHSPFAQHGMQATYDWFEQRGLPLKIEGGKRVFPVSERAANVVRVFTELLTTQGVTILLENQVLAINVVDGMVAGVSTTYGTVTAGAYVLATGGLSRPETGSTGDGHTWLSSMGLLVHRPDPSLVPLLVSDAWVHALAGVSLIDASVTFSTTKGTVSPVQTRGKMLFTHFGLSGPAILNAAAAVRSLLVSGSVTAKINLFPQLHAEALHVQIQRVFDQNKNKLVKNILRLLVPAGMLSAVADALPLVLLETPVHSVSRTDRIRLGTLLQNLSCTVTGTKGNDSAIVSDGGLDLREVDTRTMRVKKIQNLFVTGDVLHISRPSGGYSLQLCWTTGTVAGRSV